MGQESSYHEASFPFDGAPLHVAARIIQAARRDDYVLYEGDHEWTLGMGAHARVTAYPDRVVASQDGGQEERAINNEGDLSQALHDALGGLRVNGWRAYGLAPFELSRFIYRLPVAPTTELVKLFIPSEEIRIRKGSILVRGLDRGLVDGLRKLAEDACGAGPLPPAEPLALGDRIATHAAEAYKQSVQGALEEIWTKQYRKVIMSRKVPLSNSLDMVRSYVTGRQKNEPARSYLLRLDGLEAAGFSPETVCEVTEGRDVFTTPLAGTRSTGADLTEELELREELLADSKEIAEHAISVYLAYDELTMACDPTSVRVVHFMIVSRRGAVQHLASRLTGKLLARCNPWHAFNALFPAVTASGVPKSPSIEAIGRLETEPRGLYAGCVMYCDQGGELDGALVLRSFYQRGGQTWLQAGAGIMNMSKPERELEETREKLSSVAPYLIEAS